MIRALRADIRTHFAWAWTRCLSSVTATSAPLHLRLPVARVSAEDAGRREFAELVSDHLLAHEHGHVLASVVDGDRVSHHLGEDGRRPRPGADHPLLPGGVHRLDAAQQPYLDERSLPGRPRHLA